MWIQYESYMNVNHIWIVYECESYMNPIWIHLTPYKKNLFKFVFQCWPSCQSTSKCRFVITCPTSIPSNIQIVHVQGQDLALLRHLLLNQVHPDVGLHYMRLPHITHPTYQTEEAVPHAYHCILREHQRLTPLLGPGQLGKHYAHHERLNDDANTRLDHHDHDRYGTPVEL